MPKVIIVTGPPGSGKNTQAEFISKELGLPHFDTGDTLRQLKSEGLLEDREMERGGLVDPNVVRELFKIEIKKIADKDSQGIVVTGALRTMEESFGENGLVKWFEDNYGRENLLFFIVDISEEESIKRNSIRNEGRPDDLPEIIKVRLGEYHTRTKPVFDKLKEDGYNVIKINGLPSREEVFTDIKKYLDKTN